MKTYEVELQRISYVTLTIEADSPEAAEAQAWADIENGRGNINDADWSVNDISVYGEGDE